MSKKCENCIWFDRCNEDAVCEDYESGSLEEQEGADIEAYYADLRWRHEIYSAQIDEQDS